MSNASEKLVKGASEFIATTVLTASNEQLRSLAVVILDGSDMDAQRIFASLRALDANGALKDASLRSNEVLPLACPYERLKQALLGLGMSLGTQHDADPPPRTVRVLVATKGEVGMSTATIPTSAGQA
jgi:hypothetical protein